MERIKKINNVNTFYIKSTIDKNSSFTFEFVKYSIANKKWILQNGKKDPLTILNHGTQWEKCEFY